MLGAPRSSRSASLAPPEHCPQPTADSCTGRPTTPCSGSCATSAPTARGSTSTTPPATVVPDDYNGVRHAGAIMGLYQAATAGSTARWRAPTGAGVGARTTSSSTTAGRRSAVERTGPVGARRCSPPASSSAGWSPATTGDDELLRALGRFMVSQTSSRRGPCIAQYDDGTMAAGGREPLEVLHRRGVLGAGPPAPAVPRRRVRRGRRPHRRLPGDRSATTSRTTGRRSPTTGPPTGWPRPSTFPERDPRPAAHRRRAGVRPPAGRAVRQPGALGQPAGRAVGLRSCAARTCRGAAATASSARR